MPFPHFRTRLVTTSHRCQVDIISLHSAQNVIHLIANGPDGYGLNHQWTVTLLTTSTMTKNDHSNEFKGEVNQKENGQKRDRRERRSPNGTSPTAAKQKFSKKNKSSVKNQTVKQSLINGVTQLQGEKDALLERIRDLEAQVPAMSTAESVDRDSASMSFQDDSDPGIAATSANSRGINVDEALYQDLLLRIRCGMPSWRNYFTGPDAKMLERLSKSLPSFVKKHKLHLKDNYSDIASVTFEKACRDCEPITRFTTLWKFYWRNLIKKICTYILCGGIPFYFGCKVSNWLFGWYPGKNSLRKAVRNFGRLCLLGTVMGTVCFLLSILKKRRKITAPLLIDWCGKDDVSPPDEHTGTYSSGELIKCEPKTYHGFFTIAQEHLWVPRSCEHNLEIAIKCRQLITPLSTPDKRRYIADRSLQAFFPFLNEMRPLPDFDEPSMQEIYMNHLSGSKRLSFLDFLNNMNLYINRSGSETMAFVKVETLVGKALNKRHPRLISGKRDDYLHRVGPYYYCFQKHLSTHVWKDDFYHLMNLPFIYPSSLSPITLGRVISAYEDRNWYFYEADFSRLDGHTEYELLNMEMQFYEILGFEPRIVELLREQLVTFGSNGSTGISFTCHGKRASGVINTTMGNTLVCMAMASGALAEQGFNYSAHDYVVIQLGDDNVIITSRPLDEERYCKFMFDAGHDLKLIFRGRGTAGVDDTEFCSCLFWPIGEQRILGPKVGRALAKSWMPSKTINNLRKHAYGIAIGYQHYWWIPVLGYICRRIVSSNPYGRPVRDANPYKMMLNEPIFVDKSIVEAYFMRRYLHSPDVYESVFEDLDWSQPTAVDDNIFTHMLEIDGVSVVDID